MSAYELLFEKYADRDWDENAMLSLCMEFIDKLNVEVAFDYFLRTNTQEDDDMAKADVVRCAYCGVGNAAYKSTADRFDGTLIEFRSCTDCGMVLFGDVIAVDEEEEEDIE